jgi:glycosyltransferase involved in cell wall biosynthesis
VIGSVGRLAPEKNQVAIVRAAAQLRRSGAEVRVLLAGDGPMREEIVSEAGRLGIEERVTLAGEVTDVRPLLAAMDVFVLPSTSVETFSNAALEAMAMSLPVVLSDIGGAREMVAEGTEGFIIPPGDDAALRHALEQFSCDPARRQRMAAAARARVEREFSFGRMVEAYRALIAPAGDRDATVAGGSLSSA